MSYTRVILVCLLGGVSLSPLSAAAEGAAESSQPDNSVLAQVEHMAYLAHTS
jgi:hypothetical protein